jgi:type II secretory pathway component PulL
MNSHAITHLFIGDLINKENYFSWNQDSSDENIKKESITIFQNFTPESPRIDNIKKISNQSYSSYYTSKNNAFYLVSLIKIVPEVSAKKLLEDLCNENFKVSLKNSKSDQDQTEFTMLINSLKAQLSKYEAYTDTVLPESERTPHQKLIINTDNDHNHDINPQQLEVKVTSSNTRVINTLENEKIKNTVCRNNWKLILILSFVIIGIILAIILPIVLSAK